MQYASLASCVLSSEQPASAVPSRRCCTCWCSYAQRNVRTSSAFSTLLVWVCMCVCECVCVSVRVCARACVYLGDVGVRATRILAQPLPLPVAPTPPLQQGAMVVIVIVVVVVVELQSLRRVALGVDVHCGVEEP